MKEKRTSRAIAGCITIERTAKVLMTGLLMFLAMLCVGQAQERTDQMPAAVRDKIEKTNAEWKKILTPEQYYVLRNKGTEPSFTNDYHGLRDKGIFKCAACGKELFATETKFDSGTGWPSFYAPISPESIEIGRHGLLVALHTQRGLLLPQVAMEHHWTREQFLEETCRKAGLPREAWRDPEMRIFGFTCEIYLEGQPPEGT